MTESTENIFALNLPFMPEPKGRPRFTRQGNTYTPAKTRASQRQIVLAIIEDRNTTEPLFTGAVWCEIAFRILRPKSVSRKKRPEPTGKPDVDNVAKTVLDAVTAAGLWLDDAQVVRLVLSKEYVDKDPSCSIRIGKTR